MLVMDVVALILMLNLMKKNRTKGKCRGFRIAFIILLVLNALSLAVLLVSEKPEWTVIAVEAAALAVDVLGLVLLKKAAERPEEDRRPDVSGGEAPASEEPASDGEAADSEPQEVFRKVREPGAALGRFFLFLGMVLLPALVLAVITFFAADGNAVALFCSLGIVAILLAVFLVIRHHQKNKDYRLYQAARARGIKDPLQDSTDFEKLKVLAKSLRGYDRFKDWQLRSLYYYGMCKTDREAARDAERRQASLRRKDLSDKKKYEEHAGLTGREKRISTMTPQMKELEKSGWQELQAARSLTADKREHSVGLAGGIAEGIAGIGAGVAVALDTAAENERIRQWNDATRASRQAERKQYEKVATGTMAKGGALRRGIEMTQAALMSDPLSPAASAGYYRAEVEKAEATEGESLRLTVRVTGSGTPMEVMGRTAVLDGAFLLSVLENSQKIDDCRLVMPVEGLRADGSKTLMGICTRQPYDAERVSGLTFEIEPTHLWLIEALPQDIESVLQNVFKAE